MNTIPTSRHPRRSLVGDATQQASACRLADPWIPRQWPRGMTIIFFLLILSVSRGHTSDQNFFPMEKGMTWVYKTTEKKSGDDFKMTVKTEGPWKEGDASGVILTQKDKRGTMRQFLLMNDKGIFMQKVGLSKAYTPEATTRFTPPVPYLIFPLTPGTKVHWEGRLKVAWVNQPIIFDGEVVGWEEIKVPVGAYHAIKVHFHEKRGDEVIDEDAWYAEGVGQVKYDGGKFVKELEEFKKAD